MMKTFVLALLAAGLLGSPAAAWVSHDYYSQYHTYWHRWHPYPNYTAWLPYGWPMIAYTRTHAYVAGLPCPVPVNVYYIPQTDPRYNVPPYAVVAPY